MARLIATHFYSSLHLPQAPSVAECAVALEHFLKNRLGFEAPAYAATYQSKKCSMTIIAVIALKTKPDNAPNKTAGQSLRSSGILKTEQ